MRSLKDARKDAREFMQNSNRYYTLISFSKRFGYYHCHVELLPPIEVGDSRFIRTAEQCSVLHPSTRFVTLL